MTPLSAPVESEETSVDLLRERDAVSRALLLASARLAEAQDASAVLCCACDVFVDASPRIRLACMYMGDPAETHGQPDYAIGPARSCAADVWWGGGPRMRLTLGSAATGPVIADIRADKAFGPGRERALANNLEACICLPFTGPQAREQGLVVLYADQADYFRRIGVELFLAFAQLGRAALQQIAQRKHLQDLATIDALTGLLNRSALQRILESEHARSQRHGRPYSVLLLDVDRFKSVNDTYGHATGDKALVAVARTAQRSLREGDWVGRWGGDEFLCLLPDADDEKGAAIAERLRAQVSEQPVEADGSLVPVSVSVGLAHYPQAGDRLDKVLTSADAALYGAKRRGRNRVVTSSREARGLFSLANELEHALSAGRLQPAYQSIVELRSGRVVGEEALARIITEEGKLLEAGSFIQAASQLNMLRRIDAEVLQKTVDRVRQQAANRQGVAPFVNVSADLLRHPELVRNALADLGQQQRALVLEITEWELLNNTREVRRILSPFLEQGMQLAIDDFGSGYSSFQYLVDLPVSFVKIDGALVRRATRERRVRGILRGIQDMAADLELTTLAEWVEDEATAELLRDIGIQWGQGYYFGRPQLPAAAPAYAHAG